MKETMLYTTKPFMSGRSQAIRIPKEYRFSDLSEVVINRVGDSIIITPKESLSKLFFNGLQSLTDDFMQDGRPEEISDKEVKL